MAANEQTDNVIAFSGNTMVYESVKRFALKGLNDLIRVLMENVDDALFELSEKVDNDRDRSMYFDAMRQIRLQRKSIVEKFDKELQQSFNTLILNKSSPSQQQNVGELSLVEQDDVEGSLAIENMISKARPLFEDDLFAVKERFKEVLHRKQIDEDLNPLDPKAVCQSFHNACDDLDADIEVRLIFYKLFDKFVLSSLGHFYQELNDYFISKGVLPDLKASQERLNQSTRYMANRIKRNQSNSSGADSKQPDSAGSAASATVPASGPNVDGNLFAMLQQAFPSQGEVPSSVVDPFPSTGTSATENISSQAQQGGVTTPVMFNSGYMAALSDLQTANQQTSSVESTDPKQLKTQLHQQLVTFKQENSHQATESDNQIIDIISMLFDFFFDDETLPDPIKVLIGRLQIPILKIAILDKSFFNTKKHPARKLLDSISKASLGWSKDSGQEKILIDKIEEIVDFLLSEFEQDVEVFDQALEQFQQFLEQEKGKVEHNLQQVKQQELEKEQKVEVAQQVTDQLVKKLLSKHDFGFEVIEFIDGIWRSVLLNTYLTQGESSNHWKNLKKISSTLIWTLIPKHTEEEKKKLLQTLPPLLRALSKGMELVQIETSQQNLVFQMLVLEHSKIVKQTSKNIVTRVDDMTVWPEDKMAAALAGINGAEIEADEVDVLLQEDATGEMQIVDNSAVVDKGGVSVHEISHSNTVDVIRNLEEFTDCIVKGQIHIDEEIIMDSSQSTLFHQTSEGVSDDFLEQAQALEIGSWVEFTEPDSKKLNAKLSWKSNVTGKYVFVNRQGQKVRNITVHGFATELRAGRAQMIESVSVFDRAINSFMSTLRH